MKNETIYRSPTIELLPLSPIDILATSTPIFEVEPDAGEWDNEM